MHEGSTQEMSSVKAVKAILPRMKRNIITNLAEKPKIQRGAEAWDGSLQLDPSAVN